MHIKELDLEEHISKKKGATVQLQKAAEDAGFVTLPYKQHEIDKAIFVLEFTEIKDLSEIDEFINQNISAIKNFFAKIVELDAGYSIWETPLPYLYQLVSILRKPSLLNKYIELTSPSERIGKIIEIAITDYQSNH
ncbi:hypothetical protein [Pectobacterium aquaticum]|uniref:hypothetical protein n=1 Tax=Pectobacterium aquaticum TaxID=2204145 RepID=UPI000E2299D9|nr:hypothetical protein [Pectobacterium aquaticum]RRO02436.1 hypothetical protein DMB83_010555 [Pectobacterium aquaticum]